MDRTPALDWRSIVALNAVSTLAQIGQFGIAFVMLPVWMAQQGLDASQLGLFAASLWLGQLPGLAIAPRLCRHWGARRVIVAGLLCTVVALPWIALSTWPSWLVGGMLCGFGLGLRWIGVEPWLYHIAPAEARGRLVGFHETLIALAPIVAPALASFCGLQGHAIFWIGAAFVLAALLPLGWARQGTPVKPTASPVAPATDWFHGPWGEMVFRQGLVIALLGGMLEAAVSGLFSLFAQGRGMDVARTTDLLAIFGLGGLLLQYGMGWLADHRGLGMAAKVCALGIVLAAVGLAVDLPDWLMVVAVFLLGGMITALLTLALIASTLVVSGNLERNVSLISMLYTVSAIAGPLLAGASMQASHSDALMGFTVLAALVMLGFLGLLRVAGR